MMKMNDIIKTYHISRKTLLTYEKKGLINPERNQSDYRVYDDQNIRRLEKILLLRKLEFSLDEIKEILIEHHDHILLDKKTEYDKQIYSLETRKEYLHYIYDVIYDKYDIKEAIESLDETISLYGKYEEDDIGNQKMLALSCLFFSLLWLATGHLMFIIYTISMGILWGVFEIKKKKYFSLTLGLDKIISICLILVGLFGLVVAIDPQNEVDYMIIGFATIFFLYGLFYISSLRNFCKHHQSNLVLLSLILGFLIFMASFFIFDFTGFSFILKTMGICMMMLGIKYRQSIF